LQIPNQVLEVIGRRHSIRQYTDREIGESELAAILNAANKAPSAHNQQSWRFIVIRDRRKKALVDLINSKAGGFPKAASVLLRMASRSIAGAPVVIAVVNSGELIVHGTALFGMQPELAYDFFRTMEIQSSAAAVENLLLAATSLGIATVWLGILYLIKDAVLELLDEPQGEFMAVIPLGYPVRDSKGPEKRPLEMIVKRLS
jgi:nitroreductase